MAGNFSPPACCDKLPCARVCERLNCLGFLERYRRPIFFSLWGLTLASLIPGIIAMIGAARGRQLTIAPWAIVDGNGKNGYGDFRLYVGFYGVYSRGSLGREWYAWNELKDRVPESKRDDVNKCREAAEDEFSTALISVITILPSVATLWTRANPNFDSGCNKFVGVFSGLIGGASSFSSLETFVDRCYRNLPTTLRNETTGVVIGEGNKHRGPGLSCEALVISITLICGLVHLLVPVPAGKEPLLEDAHDAAAAADDKL